jgi:virulence factor Mce-like protein
MRSRWNLLIVTVYCAIAFGVLSYMAFNMIGPCRPFAGCLTLNVEFKNASGLLHSNDLRVAGVKAGQVTQIKNAGNMAIATIQVQPGYLPVYRDAHAIVRPKNLLGETYVEVDRGNASAGELREGDTIPIKNTITPVQVDEVLNALDPDTRAKLQIVINSLGEASAGRGKDLNLSAADLRRISADLAVTSTSLNQEKDNIDALLVQLDLIQQTAADDHAQLAQTLQDWNDVSATMQKKASTLADALSHLSHVLAALDQGLSPNATALSGAVNRLPTTINDAAYNTPGPQIPGAPSPNGGFLGISSTIQELFTNKPANCPTCGYSLQDGVALFPRLAQVMLGVNTCDDHIYANGYHNIPGVTEPASCPNPVDASGNSTDPNLSGEVFGHFDPNTGVAGNRHLWRVMGMIDTGNAQCGLLNPSTAPLASCAAGPNNGLAPYTPSSSASSSSTSGSSSSSSGGFWQNLWSNLTGGGGA